MWYFARVDLTQFFKESHSDFFLCPYDMTCLLCLLAAIAARLQQGCRFELKRTFKFLVLSSI